MTTTEVKQEVAVLLGSEKTPTSLRKKRDRHPFHQKHPLELVSDPPPNDGVKCICDFCLDTCSGLAYRCATCNYTLDLKCATSPKFTAGSSFPQLQHFAHEHPLLSIESHTDEAANLACAACRDRLLGPIHSCTQCLFHLHTKCLDLLPPTITHPGHRKHPLQLLAPSYKPGRGRVCDMCGYPCQKLVYNCRFCDFDIHFSCVSPPPVLKGEIHQHSFTLLLRRCEFVCDICGEKGDNLAPYVCIECGLLVHRGCVSVPPSLKLEHYRHPLVHKFSIPKSEDSKQRVLPRGFLPAPEWYSILLSDKDLQKVPRKLLLREDRALPPVLQPVEQGHSPETPTTFYCQLCRKELNPERGCYYCSEYNYAFHVDCAIENFALHQHCAKVPGDDHEKADGDCNQLVGSKSSLEQLTSVDHMPDTGRRSLDRISVLVKDYEIKGEIIRPTVIKHFDHASDLVLRREISRQETQCYACLLPLADSSYFCCLGEDYFLHEDCALLPQKLKHWSHHDVLTLAWKGVFVCDVCLHKCCATSYRCQCDFSICVPCSKIPEIIKFWAHEHLLVNIDTKYEGDCSTCGNPCGRTHINDLRSRAFRCEKECDFLVDCRCLILPRIARHLQDDHLLTLIVGEESNPHSCLCDICEESRDPKNWFYSCKECKFKAHTQCVLGNYPYIRIGDPFTTQAHEHGVQTFRAYDYPMCSVCGKYINPTDVSLKCTEADCDHIIHFECTCTCDRCHSYSIPTS